MRPRSASLSILLKTAAAHKVAVFFALLLPVSTALLEGSSYSVLLLALENLSGGANSNQYLSYLVSYTPQQRFLILLLLAVAFQFLRAALAFLNFEFSSRIATLSECNVRKGINRAMFEMELEDVSRLTVGELHNIGSRAGSVRVFFQSMTGAFAQALTCITYLVVLASISVYWLLATIGISIPVFLVQKRVMLLIRKSSKEVDERITLLSRSVVNFIENLRLIHTYSSSDAALKTLDRTVDDFRVATAKQNRLYGAAVSFTESLLIACVGIFAVVSLPDLDLATALPKFIVFTAVLYRCSILFQHLTGSWANVVSTAVSRRVIDEILDARQKLMNESPKRKPNFENTLEFKSVTKQFVPHQPPALSDVDFCIRKGERVAFVGPSGAGKSTVLDIVMGMLLPTSGNVLLDGVPLSLLDRAAWRQKLGCVTQDAPMLHGTIQENLDFFKIGFTDEQRWEACHLSRADLFIKQLPNGFQTVVGDGGHRLSNGERQRLALARALLRDPEVLILDESTNALDAESQAFIQNVVMNLPADKTVIVVAHSLSSISQVDRIYFLENGRLIEEGGHDSLLVQRGKYWSHWSRQHEGYA